MLRGIKIKNQGNRWELPTVSNVIGVVAKGHETAVTNTIRGDVSDLLMQNFGLYTDDFPDVDNIADQALRHTFSIDRLVAQDDYLESALLGFHFAYRRSVGGTVAAATQIAAGLLPASLVLADGESLIGAVVKIADTIFRVISTAGENLTRWRAEPIGESTFVEFSIKDGSPIRYLLDNFSTDKRANRYTVNNKISRNPIDVLLMHLTTMNNEFHIGDAASGTALVIDLGTPGFTADAWIGYALHCTEGTNLGEARVISDNDADEITVDRAFTNAPTAGTEYQIRNTIYDVLPLTWGLGIHNAAIDIDSFEDVRDLYLADAELGSFAFGDGDRFNLWELLQENICRPYGILLYLDRTTGKLTARYIGNVVVQSGLLETHVAVTANDILSLGDIDLVPRAPLGEISLSVRGAETVAIPSYVPAFNGGSYAAFLPGHWTTHEHQSATPTLGGAVQKIAIRAEELDTVFVTSELSSMEMSAMFNSVADCQHIAASLNSKLINEARPPPEVDILLTSKFIPLVQAGTLLAITDTTKKNPYNPHTATRGWNPMVARCLSSKISTGTKHGLQCHVQLLAAITAGKIAPAALVSSKGSDGVGDFLVIADYTYAVDQVGDKDWYGFGVSDRIDIRDLTGAVQESEVIESFGTNESATPAGSDTSRINVVGAIARVIVVGDYITFSAWSESTALTLTPQRLSARETTLLRSTPKL